MVNPAVSARPSVWSELFTFRGRTNRGRYWLIGIVAVLIVVLLAMALSAAIIAGGVDPSTSGALQFVPLASFLLMIVPILLAAIRRLHDRDKSGHWLWLFYLVPGLAGNLGQLMVNSGQALGYLLMLASFAVSIWAFVELACLRGTAGPNRFGPDPLQGLSA